MLVVRDSQRQALLDVRIAQWIDELSVHVERWFPLAGAGLSALQLREQVAQTLEWAQQAHGFTSRRDSMRYINLAAAHGWDFEARPENDWMVQYLRDPDVSSPSARLSRLVQRCLADEAAARSNQLLRSAQPSSGDLFDDAADDTDTGELIVLAEKRSPSSHG